MNRDAITRSLASLRSHGPLVLLALLILAYALYFSWYTLNRHNTLNSYAADLSLIDQPMWNTGRGPGGFMELTWGDRQQPRLAEHFEPILVPLALLFFIWDDVRILLIAQSLALALGAIPVFWIARQQFSMNNEQFSINNEQLSIIDNHATRNTQHTKYPETQTKKSKLACWSALIFAAAYLLSPHLQAANIADFHADPFVVTPLLFAFWYAGQRRWGWMWFWTVVVMSTKETLPPLAAMLGLWLLVPGVRQGRSNKLTAGQRAPAAETDTAVSRRQSAVPTELRHGLSLILVSAAWFLIATFLIVAPLARQYFAADGPIYLVNRYRGGLAGLLALLQDPARGRYLLGLLASVGFLPLLAPELLLLGLPVLAANLLSNFPGQYSGEQHYSAPLVVALIVAASYGARRLIELVPTRLINGQSLKTGTLIGAALWLASWSLSYHALHGWTPLSVRQETYQSGPAASRLPDLIAQIPPKAVVSASAAVHPHLAHRRVIYLFPTVQEADTLLVDVTDIPGVHPNDARAQLLAMLDAGWQLVEADYGLILARRVPVPAAASPLPPAFFDFARAAQAPAHPASLLFGDGQLQLLGYDLHDDPDNGVAFRFYWQALEPLPADLRLWPLVYDDLGQLLSDPSQVPMIAALWYPPEKWQPGEVIVTQTLPQLLPDAFHLGLAVGPDGSLTDPARRYPVTGGEPVQASRLFPGRWAQLASFARRGPFLSRLPATPTLHPLTLTDAGFGPAIQLTGYWFDPHDLQPGRSFPVLLRWTARRPPEADYTVFIHLLAADGRLVAQNDAVPTWLTATPTSQWPVEQALLDSHALTPPDNLPAGAYTLQVGLYDPQTLERLIQPDGSNVFRLGEVEVRN
ncbi:MAG: DUF2079 domain-containing protein [Chloroflexota bacterium]